MSNILGAAEGQVWPGMLAAGRRFAVIGALAAVASLGRASPAEARAPLQAYCMPELARLSAEWNDIGFGIPQKPSQMIVYCRFGLTSSGPEVTYMKNQIRQAFWDCRHGNVAAARERAALVGERLNELW